MEKFCHLIQVLEDQREICNGLTTLENNYLLQHALSFLLQNQLSVVIKQYRLIYVSL